MAVTAKGSDLGWNKYMFKMIGIVEAMDTEDTEDVATNHPWISDLCMPYGQVLVQIRGGRSNHLASAARWLG